MIVIEPNCYTEFEVQAYLWNALRNLGWNVRGEVKAKYKGRSNVRFDLAVFSDGNLTMIIEVKASPIKHKKDWESTRQGTRYNEYGVPVKIIYGFEQAQEFIHSLDGQQ